MSRYWQRREKIDLDTFELTDDCSARDLEGYADALLRADAKTNPDVETGILFEEHLYNRKKREVYVKSQDSNGIVDPTLTAAIAGRDERGRIRGDGQTMYNRTHPQGRKVNSEEQRKKNGASYYR